MYPTTAPAPGLSRLLSDVVPIEDDGVVVLVLVEIVELLDVVVLVLVMVQVVVVVLVIIEVVVVVFVFGGAVEVSVVLVVACTKKIKLNKSSVVFMMVFVFLHSLGIKFCYELLVLSRIYENMLTVHEIRGKIQFSHIYTL